MRTLIRCFALAKQLKPTSQTGPAFHVTFILKSGRIISIGINNYNKRNRLVARYVGRYASSNYQACIHSEVAATAKLRRRPDIAKLTIVNCRINNNNQPAFCAPCPNCALMLGQMGFRKIYFHDSTLTFFRL